MILLRLILFIEENNIIGLNKDENKKDIFLKDFETKIINRSFENILKTMLEYKLDKRIDLEEINKEFYHFKSKRDYETEFDFNNGLLLGEGAFGIVRRCTSIID